jgi:hypothetical protein
MCKHKGVLSLGYIFLDFRSDTGIRTLPDVKIAISPLQRSDVKLLTQLCNRSGLEFSFLMDSVFLTVAL